MAYIAMDEVSQTFVYEFNAQGSTSTNLFFASFPEQERELLYRNIEVQLKRGPTLAHFPGYLLAIDLPFFPNGMYQVGPLKFYIYV